MHNFEQFKEEIDWIKFKEEIGKIVVLTSLLKAVWSHITKHNIELKRKFWSQCLASFINLKKLLKLWLQLAYWKQFEATSPSIT